MSTTKRITIAEVRDALKSENGAAIGCTGEAAEANPGSAPLGGSTYVELIKSQAYMIQHQQDLLNNYIKRNADLVKVCNQVERENQTLRKKLKGHEDGKLWTLIWAMLPTRDMIEPK